MMGWILAHLVALPLGMMVGFIIVRLAAEETWWRE